MYLELGAYKCHVFVDIEDVHDTDGTFGRLAAWLRGRGVPSLDDAMNELELQPLHAALGELRGSDAVHEAARLLGIEEELPPIEVKPKQMPVARAVDAMLAKHRPDMARGRWIYEWLVERIWQDADLIALRLDRDSDSRTKAGTGNGIRPRELLRDERFRRAIGANEHDGSTWFNKERFEHAIDFLDMSRKGELRQAAEKAGYRLDLFEKEISAPPKWASTRPGLPEGGDEATEAKPPPDSTRPVKPTSRQSRPDGG
jgi:hypothetical protein